MFYVISYYFKVPKDSEEKGQKWYCKDSHQRSGKISVLLQLKLIENLKFSGSDYSSSGAKEIVLSSDENTETKAVVLPKKSLFSEVTSL